MNRTLLFVVVALLYTTCCFSQVDSLKQVLLTAKEDTNKVDLLLELVSYHYNSEPYEALDFANQALELSTLLKDIPRQVRAENEITYINRHTLSDYPEALRHALRSYALAEQVKDPMLMVDILGELSAIYRVLGDSVQEIDALTRCLALSEQSGSSQGIGTYLRFIGAYHENHHQLEKARACYTEALQRMRKAPHTAEVVLALEALAQFHYNSSQPDSSKHYIDMALATLNTFPSLRWEFIANRLYSWIEQDAGNAKSAATHAERAIENSTGARSTDMQFEAHMNYGDVLTRFKDPVRGRNEYLSALSLARSIKNPRLVTEALYALYRAETRLRNHEHAVGYLVEYHAAKDSMERIRGMQQTAILLAGVEHQKEQAADSLSHAHELDLKSAEVRKEKLIRNASFGGLALVALFAAVFLLQRNRIGKEKKRSDELLLNILPSEVAEELKANGEAKAREFEQVTILFTDFKGFTSISEKLSASALVEELNTCFKAFDRIITARGIEKIKTIGDAYMAAGGLPVPGQCSAADVVLAALEMQEFMTGRKAERDALGLPAFEMRVGIHTGPVVAGIVGVKKFAYDIWGDTVNIASRMESSGEVGQVNISEATYALVKDASTSLGTPAFGFTPRGKVSAKGKGELEMFYTSRISAAKD